LYILLVFMFYNFKQVTPLRALTVPWSCDPLIKT